MAAGTQPPGPFIIDVPGILDVISVPFWEDPQLKRDHIRRMRMGASPLPGNLQWIPSAINWIDDVQDTLITALILGKWIAPKALSRLVPYLGWALLANDVLNAGTALLAIPTTGRLAKAKVYKQLLQSLTGRAATITNARVFLKGRARIIPFALQAGQVLRTFTGYGIKLGAIMGAATDTVWGAARATFLGQQVIVQGPPPSDPLMKAVRAVAGFPMLDFISEHLTTPVLNGLLAGLDAAVSMLAAVASPPALESTLEDLANTYLPLFRPWSTSSLDALRDENFDITADPAFGVPYGQPWPTYGDAIAGSIALDSQWDVTEGNRRQTDRTAALASVFGDDIAEKAWSTYNGPDGAEKRLTPFEQMLGHAFEENSFPPWEVGEEALPVTRNTTDWRTGLAITNPSCPASAEWGPGPDGQNHNCARFQHYVFVPGVGGTLPTYQFFPDGTFIQLTPGTPGTPGGYKEVLNFRFPTAYPPPPTADRETQVQHWLWVALLIYCKEPLPLPVYEQVDLYTYKIGNWRLPDAYARTIPVTLASYLVWGQAWRKHVDPGADPLHFPKEKICFRNPDQLPLLYGAAHPVANPPDPVPSPELSGLPGFVQL